MRQLTKEKVTKERAGQTFSIRALGARSVRLAGDFTDWQQGAIPMKPASDGLWSVSVALPAGRYQYRFLVDGEWRDDPECMVRLPNPYGSHNMVRIVPQVRQEPIRSVSIPIARLEECWPGRNPTNNAQPVSFGP